MVLVFDPLQLSVKLLESHPQLRPSVLGDRCFPEGIPDAFPGQELSPGRYVGPLWMEEDALRSCLGLGPSCLPCELVPGQQQGPEAHLSYLHQGDLD